MNSTAKRRVKSKAGKSQQVKKRRVNPERKNTHATPSSARGAAFVSAGIGVDAGVLPEWKDLSSKNRKSRFTAPGRKKAETFFDQVSTAQFALVLLAAALVMGFYVRHVFATQDALSRLEQVRRENLQLQLQYNQLKGSVDRVYSPNQIYHRAKELGLEPGTEFGETIRLALPED